MPLQNVAVVEARRPSGARETVRRHECPAWRDEGRTLMEEFRPNSALLKISEQAQLPGICCNCDSVTRRIVTVRRAAGAPDLGRPLDGNQELSAGILRRTGLLGLAAQVVM